MTPSTYSTAQQIYTDLGVDTEAALRTLAATPISLHCWQGDDVGGFESDGAELSGGGIQATGNYPGKARTIEELRADLDVAYSLIPGKHRLNLHASYADFTASKKVDRNELTTAHFQSWIDWAKARGLGLDFNPHVLLAPSGQRRLDPLEPRRKGAPVLDPSTPSPAARSARTWAANSARRP